MPLTVAGVCKGGSQRIDFAHNTRGASTSLGMFNAVHVGAAGAFVPAVTYDIGSLSSGVVPEGGLYGYPEVRRDATQLMVRGYEGRVTNGAAGLPRFHLLDCLFWLGSVAYNAAPITLSGAPTFAGRVSAQGGYSECRLYAMQGNVALSGSPTITVTYTNQDGTTGRTSAYTVTSSTSAYRVWPLPLQSGDTGIQAIEGVSISGGTAGSFAVFIARPLFHAQVLGSDTATTPTQSTPDAKTGLRFPEAGVVELYGNPALLVLAESCSNSASVTFNGVHEVELVSVA